MDKEEGQNEVRRGGTQRLRLAGMTSGKGRREEDGEQVEMEPESLACATGL